MCWENGLILLLGVHKMYTRELEMQREQWSKLFFLNAHFSRCVAHVSLR